MAANLKDITGRSVAEWAGLAAAAGPAGFTATVDWLKQHHGLRHFQARLVAEARRDAEG